MKRSLAGLLVVVFLVAGIGVRLSDDASTDGQVVFSPVATLSLASGIPKSLQVVISACREVLGGLEVSGRAAGRPSPVEVAVTGGWPASAGVRVGLGFLSDSSPGSRTQVGDFVVVLPWATTESEFAVIMTEGAAAPTHGEAAVCPVRTGK